MEVYIVRYKMFFLSYIYGHFLPLLGQDSRELTGKHCVAREGGVGSAKDLEMGIELESP